MGADTRYAASGHASGHLSAWGHDGLGDVSIPRGNGSKRTSPCKEEGTRLTAQRLGQGGWSSIPRIPPEQLAAAFQVALQQCVREAAAEGPFLSSPSQIAFLIFPPFLTPTFFTPGEVDFQSPRAPTGGSAADGAQEPEVRNRPVCQSHLLTAHKGAFVIESVGGRARLTSLRSG